MWAGFSTDRLNNSALCGHTLLFYMLLGGVETGKIKSMLPF